MSIQLVKENRPEVLDNIERLLQLLFYVKLDPSQIELVRMHLDALRLDTRVMDCLCTVMATEQGMTRIIIEFKPMDFANGSPTH